MGTYRSDGIQEPVTATVARRIHSVHGQDRSVSLTGPVQPYQTVFKDALPHGIVVGVSLPPDGAPPPEEVLQRLHPDEQIASSAHRGFRLASFVGGRMAAHGAIQGLGGPFTAISSDARGAPLAPKASPLSITHKKHMAIAIAARSQARRARRRPGRAWSRSAKASLARSSGPEEPERIEKLPPDRRWTAIVLRFSIKEAIYKALAPKLQRYIGFDEASVALHTEGFAHVTLHLESGPTPEHIEARFSWMERAVLSTVRAW